MRCPKCKALLKQENNILFCEKCNCSKSYEQIAREIKDELNFWRMQYAEITVHNTGGAGLNRANSNSVVFLGNYPQSLVEDRGIISKLNDISSFSSLDGWKSMGFYAEGEETDCVLYKDVEYDNHKYRGIFIKEYRPYWGTLPSDESTTFQCSNGYKKNTVYWFKYEPLKWHVITSEGDRLLLCSSIIIDSVCFKINDNEIREKDTIIYSNNWEYSELRYWLNHTFFSLAFSSADKTKVISHYNDNILTGAWGDQYSNNQNNTDDSIFIFSYQDVLRIEYGFDHSYSSECFFRKKQGTDYAKCMGLWVDDNSSEKSSVWWLRSPGNHGCRTIGVGPKGNISICGGNVYETDYGVVPAIYVKKDIFDGIDGFNSAISKTQIGKLVLGQYPQSRVSDEELCETLLYIAGSPQESSKWNVYYDCPQNMKYVDIDYGGNRYRGVYIIEYRPYYAQTEYENNLQSFQLSNGYEKENIYWFLYSDIEWNSYVKDGVVIVQSNILLDCVYFSCLLDDNCSDWGSSYLNRWLNKDFIATAFSGNKVPDVIGSFKVPDILDVTNASGGYKTNGNMFDESRIKISTDYAKCRGIYLNDGFKTKHQKKSSFWWLSNKGTKQNKVAFVNENGIVCYNGLLPNSASCGVLPQFAIKKDGFYGTSE